MKILAASCLALALLGCGRRVNRPAACVPNATASCACRGAPNGVQTCQSDGTFGSCECVPPVVARVDDPDKPPPVTAPPEAPSMPTTAAGVRTPTRTAMQAPPVAAQQRPVPARPAVPSSLANHCAAGYSCETCSPLMGCAWCGASGECTPVPSNSCNGPESRACRGGWACNPSECPSARQVIDACARNTNCRSCAIGEACAWCAGSNSCREVRRFGGSPCSTSWVTDENACF